MLRTNGYEFSAVDGTFVSNPLPYLRVQRTLEKRMQEECGSWRTGAGLGNVLLWEKVDVDYFRVRVVMLNPCIDQRDNEGFESGSEIGALLLGGFSRGFEGPGRELRKIGERSWEPQVSKGDKEGQIEAN